MNLTTITESRIVEDGSTQIQRWATLELGHHNPLFDCQQPLSQATINDLYELSIWWREFGPQAPAMRTVALVMRGYKPESVSDRYGQRLLQNDGTEIVDADSAEIDCLRRSLHQGSLSIVGNRLVAGEDDSLLRDIIARLYYEERMIVVPSHRHDHRVKEGYAEPSLDIIVPVNPRVSKSQTMVSGPNAMLTNGGFFIYCEEEFLQDSYSSVLDPVGLVIAQGEVVNPAIYRRPAILAPKSSHGPLIRDLAIDDMSIFLGNYELSSQAVGPGFFKVTSGKNYGETWGSIFTRYSEGGRSRTRTPARSGVLELAICRRRVVAAKRGGEITIPLNGFVISIEDESAVSEIQIGIESESDWLEVQYTLSSIPEEIESGLSTSVSLIRNGVDVTNRPLAIQGEFVSLTVDEQGIPPVLLKDRILHRRRAFSGIGIREDESVVLVVAEGCEPRSRITGRDSYGISVDELGERLALEGCVDAVALDGGGSVMLRSRNGFVIHPSDRHDVPMLPFERYGSVFLELR